MYRPTNIFLRKEYLAQQSSQVFRRIAVSKFQGNRYVLNNVIGCGYLTAICYGNIPVFHLQ